MDRGRVTPEELAICLAHDPSLIQYRLAREFERLTAERDAWKALAKARGLRLFGQWSVAPELAAENRLRALGITPEEEP